MAKQNPAGHKIEHNASGLPDTLKSGMEALSGLDLSDVQVHRNSHAPSKIGAQAFPQGSDIYLASGGEKLIAHELPHVVQQRQGNVNATNTLSDAERNAVRAEIAGKK